jgi:hypothetical protein
MARADERFANIVRALAGRPGVSGPATPGESPRRFGSSALKVNGKIFAMISSTGDFVVKLPAARVAALIASGQGKIFDAGRGRAMKEWLVVQAGSDAEWIRLADEALQFVASPPSRKRPTRPRAKR